jgi:hypothetical protein
MVSGIIAQADHARAGIGLGVAEVPVEAPHGR